jgi:hypothetical protein
MVTLRKRVTPVDRCVAELNERMAAVQHQIRALEGGQTNASGSGQDVPAQSENHFFKRVLSILDQIPAPSPQKGRALPDEIADPLKDLGAESREYGSGKQPELFTVAPRSLATEPAKPAAHGSKLARYLEAIRLESSIPIRRVQRQTRNKFWMWLGLGLIVVFFICVVVR